MNDVMFGPLSVRSTPVYARRPTATTSVTANGVKEPIVLQEPQVDKEAPIVHRGTNGVKETTTVSQDSVQKEFNPRFIHGITSQQVSIFDDPTLCKELLSVQKGSRVRLSYPMGNIDGRVFMKCTYLDPKANLFDGYIELHNEITNEVYVCDLSL